MVRVFRSLLPLILAAVLALPAEAKKLDTSMFCVPGNRASYVPIGERREKGLFFRIEHCQHTPSYILGTLHTDDPDIIADAAPAFTQLKTSRRAIFEVVLNPDNQKKIIQQMLLPQQVPGLKDQLGDETFTALTEAVQDIHSQFPPAVLNRYKPWAAAVLLQFPPKVADGIVLDDRLQNKAALNRIPVLGLETVEQQFAVFNGMTADNQMVMLKDTLSHLDDLLKGNKILFALYKSHDLKAIQALGEEAFGEISDPELRVYLKEEILVKRNHHMGKALLPYLAEGNNFIAVGAMHLPGESGILTALEKQGYFINVIY